MQSTDALALLISKWEFRGKRLSVVEAMHLAQFINKPPPKWDGTITVADSVMINGVQMGPGTYYSAMTSTNQCSHVWKPFQGPWGGLNAPTHVCENCGTTKRETPYEGGGG